MRARRGTLRALLVLLSALALLAEVQFARPVPAASLRVTLPAQYRVPGRLAPAPWPSSGEAALYVSGPDWEGSSGGDRSLPVASLTKIMTALVVLRAHPLGAGQEGPQVVVDAAQVQLYRSELGQGDSVLPVVAGESLTELQLLEALLVPSADNIATLLADWDAGSETAFVGRMNALAASWGLGQTHFADASGLDPGSSSSAADLVRLARLALASPVLAGIVALPAVQLPVAGLVRNYNPVLGEEGVDGVKTGWTGPAGGCLAFAARETVSGQPVLLVGAVLGQPGDSVSALRGAGQVALGLISWALSQLRRVRVVARGRTVALASSAWSPSVPLRTRGAISVLSLAGGRVRLEPELGRARLPLRAGALVGRLTALPGPGAGVSVALLAGGAMTPPSPWWRLLHG